MNLEFFVADGGGVKGSGRLDSYERGELKDVALNHVPQGAGSFIEAAASLDTKSFGGSDLYVVDVIAVPKRFEDAIAEAKHEEILNRVFAKIVIDAIDLRLFENVVNNFVKFPGGGEITAEGFLDDDTDPGFGICRAGETGTS